MAAHELVDGCCVAPPESDMHSEPEPGAQRLIVLWLCWVALALFLVAAGVCGLW